MLLSGAFACFLLAESYLLLLGTEGNGENRGHWHLYLGAFAFAVVVVMVDGVLFCGTGLSVTATSIGDWVFGALPGINPLSQEYALEQLQFEERGSVALSIPVVFSCFLLGLRWSRIGTVGRMGTGLFKGMGLVVAVVSALSVLGGQWTARNREWHLALYSSTIQLSPTASFGGIALPSGPSIADLASSGSPPGFAGEAAEV
jgi:hypothetical protein